MNHSVVEYFGKEESGHKCGYCKSPDSSLAHGMWAHYLTCQDYQDLLDRGWRRSGKYCYKPIMDKTCCPQYTIRLDVTTAKLRKSQKKAIKCFNRFLSTGVVPSSSQTKKEEGNDESGGVDILFTEEAQKELQAPTTMDISFTGGLVKGADPSRPKCRKAKEIRKEKRLEKNAAQGQINEQNTKKNTKKKEKTYEEWIEDIPLDSKIKFEVKLVRCCPQDTSFKETFEKELEVYKKYQIQIHNDEPSEVTESQPVRFGEDSEDVPECGLGAFHQQYYFDGKLIAVGVLDILPTGVSSKYFFYDPDYQFLSLGTFSALREIYFIRSLHRQCPSIKYYYMGYYIHSCAKMKYKGNFIPSYLLCPETYIWQPIENCVDKLDASKYSRLEDDKTKEAETFSPDNTHILHQRQAMTFEVFYSLTQSCSDRKEHLSTVKEYTTLTGKASRSILLFLS